MKIPNGWRKVKFGDVVKKVNDKVPNRDEWTFERYIGGEHFDEGEIRITRSNPIKGNEEVIGSAFHMRFKPGQVLYVTRNPRLRKGGMVDFEGVCSNVSFVLEADESQLLQSLLSFVIQTEDFVMHTCNNAHGSTNPFLNWKDIAKYEFLLPPIEEQKKISEVLWSVEENYYNHVKLYKKFRLSKRIISNSLFTKGINSLDLDKDKFGFVPKNWKKVRLEEFSKVFTKQTGFDYSAKIKPSLVKTKNEGVLPFIQNKDFGYKSVNYNTDFYIPKKVAENYPKILLDEKCILISISGKIGNVGIFDNKKTAFLGGAIAVIKLKDESMAEWILYYLKSKIGQRKLFFNVKASSHQNLILSDLRDTIIPLPDDKEKYEIIHIINKIDKESENLYLIKKSLLNLRNKLSNELLSGKVRLEDGK